MPSKPQIGHASSPPERNSQGRSALKVWIDFVCPYCFLAEAPLREAIAGTEIEIEWLPLELRPHPQPTLRPEGDYLQSVWKRSVYPLAAQLGINVHLPTVSPQPYSRLAFEGMQFAKRYDKTTEYVDAVLRAFFQQDRDIGDLDVLVELAGQIGLPGDAFAAALREGRFRETHQAALALAQRVGVHAVPTIEFAGHRVEGMPSPLMLRRLIEAAASNEGRAIVRP